MLYATLNNSNANVEREQLVISHDEMKEIAKANKVTVKSVAVQIDIINALIVRMNYQFVIEGKDINSALIREYRSNSSITALQQIDYLHKQKFNLSDIAKLIAITDKSHADFCAIYAIEKIFNLLRCLASKDRNKLNGYTKAMLVNLLEHDVLTIDECKCAVSRELHQKAYSAKFSGQKQIRLLYNSGKSTAGTQVSSSRMCLKALNVCHVRKGSSKDEITFNSEAQYTQAVLNLLQMTDNSSEEIEKISQVLESEMNAKEA